MTPETKEVPEVMKRFKDKLDNLTLSERINYPQIILTKLFDVFTSPTEELWQENIRRLYLAIPTPWKNKAFLDAVDEAQKALDETVDEIVEDEVLTSEEEVVYEADLNEYWEDILTAVLNLFHQLGILVKPIVKEVIP